MQLTDKHKRYWRLTLLLTGLLLAVWFVVTFVVGWFAWGLQGLSVLGFPLPFYMAAQGAPLVFVAMVWLYAHIMEKLDRRFGVEEEES